MHVDVDFRFDCFVNKADDDTNQSNRKRCPQLYVSLPSQAGTTVVARGLGRRVYFALGPRGARAESDPTMHAKPEHGRRNLAM